MAFVSVIVPVYNAEQYLARCVNSILSQSYPNFELILVDDGSLDRCGDICDTFATQDHRIRVIHQENQGQAAARNHGVSVATGQWVCFVDSDDAIHPSMLEEMVKALSSNPDAKICAAQFAEGNALPEDFSSPCHCSFHPYSVTQDFLVNLLSEGRLQYYCICAELIHIDIVRKIPFTAGKVYEDSAVACQWLFEAKTVLITETPLYFYQTNPEGTTKSSFSMKRLDGQWSLLEQISFCKKQRFYGLGHILGNTYLRKAKKLYQDICNLANNPRLQKQFQRDTLRFYRKHKKLLSLSFTENRFVFDVLCPIRMKFYWTYMGIKNKLFK